VRELMNDGAEIEFKDRVLSMCDVYCGRKWSRRRKRRKRRMRRKEEEEELRIIILLYFPIRFAHFELYLDACRLCMRG
jgi:hypothetical protein